jgi:hypothetical protein
MRARTRLSADQWAARLDAEMERVLARPSDFHPSVRFWATWRRDWLAAREHANGEGTQNLYTLCPETAARPQFLRAAARLNATGRQEVNDEAT